MPITEPIDEDELEADLAAMEQEKLDDQMLSTGTTVPVADRIDRQHAAANGTGELISTFPLAFGSEWDDSLTIRSERRDEKADGGGRRRGGAAEVAG